MQRLLDVLLSGLALLVLSPLLVPVAIALRLTGEGEVFFIQQRVGRGGQPFGLYKFATMLKDSPNIGTGTVTVKGDPRVLPLGRLLRKTKINELPQLLNILKGDMSIIGPRPVVEKELAEYGNRKDKFLSVRPGAMGLWQATGRSNISYPERCDVELEYIDNISFAYDVKIFFQTIFSIFKKEGAY